MAATLLAALVDDHGHRRDGGHVTFHLRKRGEQ
jgi:hypothetical protein